MVWEVERKGIEGWQSLGEKINGRKKSAYNINFKNQLMKTLQLLENLPLCCYNQLKVTQLCIIHMAYYQIQAHKKSPG